jgi:hypothetical protein
MDLDGLPSGRWIGFYCYSWSRSRHRMDLRLEITPDRITGSGIDDVGGFLITGRVHEDLKVTWVKTYLAHEVLYDGRADHHGIWGTWRIPAISSGGFRIWPEAWGEGVAREIEAEEFVPIEEEAPDAVPAPVPAEPRRGV